MGEDFKDKYRVTGYERFASSENDTDQQRRTQKPSARYTAPKGSAHRAQQRRKQRKLNPRFVGLVLSLIVAGSAVGIVSNINKEPETTFSKLIEEQVNVNSLGLSQETMDSLLEYQEYFENSTSKNLNGKNLLELEESLYNTNLIMIKEKMAEVLGCDAGNIEVHISFSNGDGRSVTTVEVYKHPIYQKTPYEKPVIYQDIGAHILPIKDETTLPQEVCDMAWQLSTLEHTKVQLQNHKISDANAWKELKKCFENLNEFATKEIIRDEKGNLAIIDYSDTMEKETSQEERE